jgi:excisionase family DNA binding protein
MAVAVRKSMPVVPHTRDIDLAEKASSAMRNFLASNQKGDILFLLNREKQRETIEFFLTPVIVEFFFRTLLQIANGNAVTLIPIHAELTTQEAANLLNVSRPYFIQLLEKGKIRFRKVGRHRRILFADILKYQEKSDDKSRKAREALIKQAQELDLGY